MVYLGTKGDWPFLRSAFKLGTGFNCARVCHLCNVSASGLGSCISFVFVAVNKSSALPLHFRVPINNLLKEWWDVKGAIQDLPADTVPECPFKPGAAAALRLLPDGDDPKKARVDPAHTWAIVGIGKDLCGSTIVLGARMGLFGRGAIRKRMDTAYDDFQDYLVRWGKYSSISDFSYKTLKCGKTILSLHLRYSFLC